MHLQLFTGIHSWCRPSYGFSIIKEAETGDILTIGVFLENCNKDEWSEIAQKNKELSQLQWVGGRC